MLFKYKIKKMNNMEMTSVQQSKIGMKFTLSKWKNSNRLTYIIYW